MKSDVYICSSLGYSKPCNASSDHGAARKQHISENWSTKKSSNSIIKTRRIFITSIVYCKTDIREERAHQTIFITVDDKCLTSAVFTRCS